MFRWKLDPRLLEDLRRQRGPISMGLVCVVFGALLTASTIPLTEQAIRAIGEAAPLQIDVTQDVVGASDLQEEFNLTETEAREAAARIEARKAGETNDARAARQDAALHRLGMICLAVIGVFILKYTFTRGQAYNMGKAAAQMARDLRERLFEKLQRLPMRYYHEKRIGSIQSSLTNDVNVYQNSVTMVRDGIDGPFKAVLALGAIFWIKWELALLALLFIPPLAIFVQRNGRRMKAAQTEVQEDLGGLTAMTNEAITGARVIKAFAAEDQIIGLHNSWAARSLASQLKAVRRFASLRPMVELLGAVSLATILYICGHLARSGDLRVSEIVALTMALDQINQGAKSLANMNNTYQQVQAAAQRLYREILDVDEEPVASGAKTLENPQGKIEFHDVTFAYPDGTLALQGVNFVIEPGTSLALVGPSGAGKSTIADLLLRFYDPTEGTITFDGIDLRELETGWLRKQFGVVPQQTFLFAGTIEDNIRLAAPDAPAESLDDAVQAAHVDAFVSTMPERYDTQLGERGVRLSGGEMQRLAIARALVRDPRVLLMDEATRNLDAVSEKYVTEALDRVMRERTTLFIAHRLTTAARAHQLAVLSRGEIVEIGSHAELMERDGVYAGMYRAFTAGTLGDGL